MNIIRSIFLTGALLFAWHLNAQGATIVFREGDTNAFVTNYSGTSDTSLASNASTRNGGGLDYFAVGRSFTRRSILRFDLSSLNGEVNLVQSASLTLNQSGNATSANLTIAVYVLTSANAGWNEGTGNLTANANTGEATWGHFAYNTVAWAGSQGASTAGTDYVATSLATFVWKPTDTSVSFNISNAVISQWISSPSTNAGLLFVATDGSGVNAMTANFGSSENATQNLRPLLTINYEAVPEPGTWALAALGLGIAAMVRTTRKK